MHRCHYLPFFPTHLGPSDTLALALQFAWSEGVRGLQLLERAKREADLPRLLDALLLSSVRAPWALRGGVLDQLFFYAEQVRGSALVERPLEEMARQVVARRRGARSATTVFLEMCRTHLAAFLEALLPSLERAKGNENVLWCLIENHAEVDRLLGPSLMQKIWQRLAPTGLAPLRAMLREQYTRRGFSEFFAEQEPRVVSIWALSTATLSP